MKIVKIYHAYDLPPSEGLNFIDPLTGEPEVSQTEQSELENCDINVLMKRYERSGVLPVMKGTAFYGDVASAPSYQEAQNILITAQNAFNSLPSEIRKEFDNDPAKYLAFCEDPSQ